jgi:hypothetical protein
MLKWHLRQHFIGILSFPLCHINTKAWYFDYFIDFWHLYTFLYPNIEVEKVQKNTQKLIFAWFKSYQH